MVVILGSGLLAGAVHVLSGPDHLAALAPLSLRARRSAWAVGLRWGLGHSSGVLFVGLIAMVLKEFIHLEALSAWGDRLVGVVLIGVGLWGFRSLSRDRVHAHTHTHPGEGGEAHTHVHVHSPGEDHSPTGTHVHGHTAFLVGTLHGLAGTSHLLGVLPALALPSVAGTSIYLLSFAVGSIAAMIAFATVLGVSTARPGTRAYVGLLGSTSALAIFVGVGWIVVPLLGYRLP